MKKIILKMLMVTGIVAGAALSSNAQISKGSLMLGGSLGAKLTTESKTTLGSNSSVVRGYTEWNFTPTGGYFVAEGIVLGLGLNIDSKSIGEVTNNDNSITEQIMGAGFGINLFIRKYFEVVSNVYFHTQAGFGYTSITATDKVPDGSNLFKDGDKYTSTDIGINITPGLTYFLSPKWGLDFSLNNIVSYNSSTKTLGDGASKIETTGGGFSVGAGLTPSLGLFYYINN